MDENSTEKTPTFATSDFVIMEENMQIDNGDQKLVLKKQKKVLPENTEAHLKTNSPLDQLKQASAGALASAASRTLTQPFDVLKIRFQLQVEPTTRGANGTAAKSKYTSILQACRTIHREEGVRAFWKGHNAGQMMSIVYGVLQFWSYEQAELFLQQMPWLGQHAYFTNFVAGGIAGSTATVFSMPFDVIRTRIVAQDHGDPSGYRSIAGAFPIIFREEGMRGFFRGLMTTMIQVAPLVGANFMFYHTLNDVARKILHPTNGNLPPWATLITGGVAGVASKAAVYPLDFVKKRLQLRGFESRRKTYGRNQLCDGIMHCIQITYREEGARGFYKGIVPTLMKSGLTSAIYFSIYDELRLLLLKKTMD